MSGAGDTMTQPTLADRVCAALAEVGASDMWQLKRCSDPNDPSFVYDGCNWKRPNDYGSDEEWTVLWQAFGVARPDYVVPCLACYLDGSAWSEYQRDVFICEAQWPSHDCGRDRSLVEARP